jgi:hypothetical protein
MICYLDMTFCRFHEDCNEGDTCERAATNEVWNDAELMRLPLSVYAEKPQCFNPKMEEE